MARGLLILAYHRVLDGADPLRGDITADAFEEHMRVVARYFNAVPLGDGVRGLEQGKLPARAVAITFDDGYADNHSVALPILKRYGLPATIFVASGFLDGGRMWNDTVIESIRNMPGESVDLEELGLGRHATGSDTQRATATHAVLMKLKYLASDERKRLTGELAARAAGPLPTDLMLTSAQVRELSNAGVEIGAHTVSHPILTSLDPATARSEITGAKQRLEDITGRPVRSFAYPNGKPGVDYDDDHVTMVRESGFDVAVATCLGMARPGADHLQLPRFGPWAESRLRFGMRLLRMHLR